MQPQDPNNQQQPQQPAQYPEQPLTQPLPPAGNQPLQPNYGSYQPDPQAAPPQTPPPTMPPQPQQQQPQQQPPQPGQQDGSQPAGPDQAQPQQMYYSRPLDPAQPVITPEIKKKSDESHKKYPHLNLSEGEFILSDVKRHPIGLLGVWVICGLAVAGIVGTVGMLASSARSVGSNMPIEALGIGAALLCVLVLIGGYIATFIYRANTFYLTNESVIQNIQMSLFSNRQQTVSLSNVEDASYLKTGIIQTLLDYGTIRLSTQGDETTYRFTFASDPDKQVARLNNAVEAFKNGRPFHDDDDYHPNKKN